MKRSRRPYDPVKRALDVVVAATLLVVLSPLLIAIALLVAFALGRPVLFTQKRPGRGGRLFTIYKFRTMLGVAQRTDDVSAVASDAERLTRLGRLLRSSSLDELPELWNIVKGDMSFVGPRPLLVEYLDRYNERQARRHEVRPGLTGWAQVNGRNATTWKERFELDVHYVDNRSLLLDARIVWMTLGTVFSRTGVSAAGHATMQPFDPARDNTEHPSSPGGEDR